MRSCQLWLKQDSWVKLSACSPLAERNSGGVRVTMALMSASHAERVEDLDPGPFSIIFRRY